MKLSDIPIEIIRDAISYDAESGELTWKIRKESDFCNSRGVWVFNSMYFGKPPSIKLNERGYPTLKIFGIRVAVHRLAWILFYGKFPLNIDHISGDKSDNRISNLRDVSQLENSRNSGLSKNNKSGFNGVGWRKIYKKWYARIKVKGKTIHLGQFNSIDDAIAARVAANIKYGFHANHGMRNSNPSYQWRKSTEGV